MRSSRCWLGSCGGGVGDVLAGAQSARTVQATQVAAIAGRLERLGVELAENLLKHGADVILREVYGSNADTSADKLLEN